MKQQCFNLGNSDVHVSTLVAGLSTPLVFSHGGAPTVHLTIVSGCKSRQMRVARNQAGEPQPRLAWLTTQPLARNCSSCMPCLTAPPSGIPYPGIRGTPHGNYPPEAGPCRCYTDETPTSPDTERYQALHSIILWAQ